MWVLQKVKAAVSDPSDAEVNIKTQPQLCYICCSRWMDEHLQLDPFNFKNPHNSKSVQIELNGTNGTT